MKWLVVASIICCGGLLLLILIGANISLVAGIFLDFWPAILAGFLLLMVGLVYYVRRRQQKTDIGGKNMAEKTIKLHISGMTCQGCADTVTRSLKKQKGVEQVSIDWGKGSGEVVINTEITGEEDILRNRVFEGHYSAALAK